MKWVKHMTATWDDEKIARLVKSGGAEGLAAYGLWWRILEIVASQMDPKTKSCSVTYDVSRWSLLLSLRGSHVRQWVEKLALTTLVTAEWAGSELTVTIPNLLKYRDEYTQKSRHSRSIEGEGDLDLDLEQSRAEQSRRAAPSAPSTETDEAPQPSRRAALSIGSIPPDTERRIRKLADDCPDQQDLPAGIDLAMQAVLSSSNPTSTITAMEANLPLWWDAMRDGRAKVKQFRWVVKDNEYLRKPREPTPYRHRKSPDLSRICEGL